jgi:hypothetical protein
MEIIKYTICSKFSQRLSSSIFASTWLTVLAGAQHVEYHALYTDNLW